MNHGVQPWSRSLDLQIFPFFSLVTALCSMLLYIPLLLLCKINERAKASSNQTHWKFRRDTENLRYLKPACLLVGIELIRFFLCWKFERLHGYWNLKVIDSSSELDMEIKIQFRTRLYKFPDLYFFRIVRDYTFSVSDEEVSSPSIRVNMLQNIFLELCEIRAWMKYSLPNLQALNQSRLIFSERSIMVC